MDNQNYNQNTDANNTNRNRAKLSLDLRWVSLLLVLVIVGMLAVWKPWVAAPTAKDQTITVTGESTISASPDEFVFYPTYEFKSATKEAGLADIEKKSTEVVAGLKKLGVEDSKIKTNSNGYENNYDSPTSRVGATQSTNYSLQITVTVKDKDTAQKVQDYLVSTVPTGSVSPQAAFSDAKKKTLDTKARDEATKDARQKANQSAKNLGFKVGKVKSVTDGQQEFGIMPMTARASSSTVALDATSTKSELSVQPGENDLDYSVTVVYYIK